MLLRREEGVWIFSWGGFKAGRLSQRSTDSANSKVRRCWLIGSDSFALWETHLPQHPNGTSSERTVSPESQELGLAGFEPQAFCIPLSCEAPFYLPLRVIDGFRLAFTFSRSDFVVSRFLCDIDSLCLRWEGIELIDSEQSPPTLWWKMLSGCIPTISEQRWFSGTSSIRRSSLYSPIESAFGVAVTPSESQWEIFGRKLWSLSERQPPSWYGKELQRDRRTDWADQWTPICKGPKGVGADGKSQWKLESFRFQRRREDQSSVRTAEVEADCPIHQHHHPIH